MALDKLVDSNQLDGALSFTADAIREKTGEVAPITWDMDTGFTQAIEAISGGIDTSDANATSSDILDGKTAYVNGVKVEGNIPTKTGSNLSVSGKTVTAPAGYYASNASASVADGSLSASVSSNSDGSASMAATGFTAAIGSTNYYVTLSTSSGSVKAKASVATAGYVDDETAETAATSVAVSGNGNKLYIPAGSITNNTSGGTSSGTIDMGSQIKIGKGYYGSDTYYTAKDVALSYDSTHLKGIVTY